MSQIGPWTWLNLKLTGSSYHADDYNRSIPWEIANAFSAMLKRNRLTIEEAQEGLSIFNSIFLRYTEPDFVKALKLSKQTNMYAYDAYFLDCAIRHKAPLLTLDKKLKASAQIVNVEIMEV